MNRFFEPLAFGFRLGVALRTTAYRRGWFQTRRLNRPVISVGNLAVGGTGKTPLVAFIAEKLIKRDWKPSILTRGYGRRRGPNLISIAPSSRRAAAAREVGDEPALLARALPAVPIVVGADRYRAGRLAEDRFDVDVHLLDDGFQHLALARDVDVVLLDLTQEFSDQALVPAGPLREPCSALKRAHLVVLTRVDLGDPHPLEESVARINPQARIFHSRTLLCKLVEVGSGRPRAADDFRGQRVCAFCGLGNPRAFFTDLGRWGFSVVAKTAFPDHHVYTPADFNHLGRLAREVGAAALLTTEKDALNFPPLWQPDIPVAACVIETRVCESESFEETLIDRLKAVRVAV